MYLSPNLWTSKPNAVRRRCRQPGLRQCGVLPRLAATEDARELAVEILRTGLIPSKAAVDASHIAVAVVHQMDILLTWNCKHIHNIAISRQIERLCAQAGWPCPAICTPFDLLAT